MKKVDKVLILVDMQNDFIDGSLRSTDAKAIVPKVESFIKDWDGDIVFTQDTHNDNYLNTFEGIELPISHCIENTEGWGLNERIYEAALYNLTRRELPWDREVTYLKKDTFGSLQLPAILKELGKCKYKSIYIMGLCTDICVVTNALILRTEFPEVPITVIKDCCAGTSKENHEAALNTLKSCQVFVMEGTM